MNETLSLLGAGVAIVGSVLGALLAIDQLTIGARARRNQQWARQGMEAEDNEHRLAVLRSIETRAGAQVVGSVLVPGKHFLEVLAWALGTPASVWVLLSRLPDALGGAWVVISAVLTAAGPARRGIRIYLERQRVISEYAGGRPVIAPKLDLVNQMEGGTRREFVDAILFAVGLSAAGLGLFWTTSQDLQQLGVVVLASAVVAGVVATLSVRQQAQSVASLPSLPPMSTPPRPPRRRRRSR